MIRLGTVSGFKKLNKGKKTELYSPLPEEELNQQLTEIFISETYKPALRKKNAVYLDVGANIGMAATYFKDWAKMIYSIEPAKECFQALELNTKNMTNIKRFNLAIAGSTEKMRLFGVKDSVPQTFYSELIRPIDAELPVASIDVVDAVTMDKFFEDNKIKHIDVMKIDVEGYEYIIFGSPGFEKVAKKIDFIIGESHFTPDGGMPMFLPEILKEYGFEVKWMDYHTYVRNLTIQYGDKIKKYKVRPDTMFVAERKK
jgi:FkbM family methyltransferase